MDTRVEQATAAWWTGVKADPARFNDWLAKQYHGEVTAAGRIEAYAAQHVPEGTRTRRVLGVIAGQERQHAAWVADLLRTRGIEPRVLDKPERYWEETAPGGDTLEAGAAVAAHAEEMRLVRIEAIAADPEAPADVRGTFARILRDERFHARAFARIAGPEAMERARADHERGLARLGLITFAEAA